MRGIERGVARLTRFFEHVAAGNIEHKNRRTGARQDLPLDAAVARFAI